MNGVTSATPTSEETRWRGLYRIGGAATLAIAPLYVIELIVFIASSPLPATVLGWFSLLQRDPLVGVIDLYLLELPLYALMGVMFLVLYVALRRTSEAPMVIGTFLGAIGVVLFFALNPALSMLALSNQYAAATSEADRAMLLAAGQSALTMTQSTGFSAAFLLTTLAGLIASVVMLRARHFHRATAYAGLLTNVLLLALYVPAVGLLLWMLGGLVLPVWLVLVGWDLLRMGRPEKGRSYRASPSGVA